MNSKFWKQLRSFVLLACVLCNSIVFCAEKNAALPLENEKHRGALAKIKDAPNAIGRGFKKIYHCITGNHETCTFNEIIGARLIVIGMLTKLGQVIAHQRMQARRAMFAARASGGGVDLSGIRARATARRQRDPLARAFDTVLQRALDDSVDNADRYAGRANAAAATRLTRSPERIEHKRDQFLRGKSIPAEEDAAEVAACCVCFEENSEELKLDYIPCQSDSLHSAQLCLACLSRLISDYQGCPICRGELL